MLAVRPRVLPERPEAAKRSEHRPLVGVVERLDARFARRLTGPRRRDPAGHVGRDGEPRLAAVGVDLPLAATGLKAIKRTAVEDVQPRTQRFAWLTQRRPRLRGRSLHCARVQVHRALQSRLGRDARKFPVHHPDAGGKPDEEQQAERNPQPPVQEDQRPLEHAARSVAEFRAAIKPRRGWRFNPRGVRLQADLAQSG